MKNIAILASGRGSNAMALVNYFEHSAVAKVKCLICNKKDAPVLKQWQTTGLPAYIPEREKLNDSRWLNHLLQQHNIDFVLLAGYLQLLPEGTVKAFEGRILNIHPSLLPKYGGKGMYGMNIHQAVLHNHEKESGISIHLVNEKFDEGRVIFQKKIAISSDESAASLAEKINNLELKYFPKVAESYIREHIL